MGETFFKNDDDKLLSISDYIEAYDNDALKYLSSINTGLLDTVNTELDDLVKIETLVMPNVQSIHAALCGDGQLSYLREIYAPKLKVFNIYAAFPQLSSMLASYYYSNLTKITLRDVEYINISNFYYTISYFKGFYDLSEFTLSKLQGVVGNIFKNMYNVKCINLPELYSISGEDVRIDGLPYLESIYMPKLTRIDNLRIWNLPKLKTLSVNRIWNGAFLYNLPSLKELYVKQSGIMSLYNVFNGGSFSTLSVIYAENIDACELFFEGQCLKSSTNLILTKCKNVLFPSNVNYNVLNTITLPALSELSLSNLMLSDADWRSKYKTYCQWPGDHTLNIPNVLRIYSEGDVASYNGRIYGDIIGDTYNMSNGISAENFKITINAVNCTSIDSYMFRGRITQATTYSASLWHIDRSEGLRETIFNTPKLENIGEYAFAFCSFLGEINIQNVSVLNEGVFRGAFGYLPIYDWWYMVSSMIDGSKVYEQLYSVVLMGTCNLKGIGNVQEVRSYALENCMFISNTLNLMNCRKFDFNQCKDYLINLKTRSYTNFFNRFTFCDISEKRKVYGPLTVDERTELCNEIYNNHYGLLKNFIAPKLSCIEFEIPSSPSGYQSVYQIHDFRLLTLTGYLSLNTCRYMEFKNDNKIGFYYDDTYHSFTKVPYYKSALSFAIVADSIYIPKCSSIIWDTVNPDIFCLNARQIYAPELSYIKNIGIVNCDSVITYNEANFCEMLSYVEYSDINYTHYSSYSSGQDIISYRDIRSYTVSNISFSYSTPNANVTVRLSAWPDSITSSPMSLIHFINCQYFSLWIQSGILNRTDGLKVMLGNVSAYSISMCKNMQLYIGNSEIHDDDERMSRHFISGAYAQSSSINYKTYNAKIYCESLSIYSGHIIKILSGTNDGRLVSYSLEYCKPIVGNFINGYLSLLSIPQLSHIDVLYECNEQIPSRIRSYNSVIDNPNYPLADDAICNTDLRVCLFGSEIYAPKLSYISTSFITNNSSHVIFGSVYFSFGDLYTQASWCGLNSITLGISNFDQFFGIEVQVPNGIASGSTIKTIEFYPDYYSLNYNGVYQTINGRNRNESIYYVSLSNIKVFDRRYLVLPYVKEFYMDNVEYFSNNAYLGLTVFSTELKFSKLKKLEGQIAGNINTLSIPVLSYLGSYALRGCSKMTYVELPKCSYVGDCAFNSKIKIVKLGYSGVATIGSLTHKYDDGDTKIIQVPMSLLSSYHSRYGSTITYTTYYNKIVTWNIMGY